MKIEVQYQQQLAEKTLKLEELLKPFFTRKLQVFPSTPTHYRMRAEFRVWHDGDDLYYIMFDAKTKKPFRVDSFPPASKTINSLMVALIERVKASPILRKKLFQVDFLSGLSNETVISLLYHRQLDDEWDAAAQELKRALSGTQNVNLIGRARKQKRVIGYDFIIESLPIANKTYQFKHIENSFTQPNAMVNTKMIEWALDCCQSLGGDLLELYCGAGNFSIPLAQHFGNVVGTEIAKPSVEAAQFNIEINQAHNVQIARLSSEEFVQAMDGKREFNRLQSIPLEERTFSTVLVDPPRSGLDAETTTMISRFDNIVYISCNPTTLVENLKVLSASHDVVCSALFDQFPFTEHIESGVLLRKRV